jgi:hypothetical protein
VEHLRDRCRLRRDARLLSFGGPASADGSAGSLSVKPKYHNRVVLTLRRNVGLGLRPDLAIDLEQTIRL